MRLRARGPDKASRPRETGTPGLKDPDTKGVRDETTVVYAPSMDEEEQSCEMNFLAAEAASRWLGDLEIGLRNRGRAAADIVRKERREIERQVNGTESPRV
ncbi:unnamed protein product [Lampetra planeri]